VWVDNEDKVSAPFPNSLILTLLQTPDPKRIPLFRHTANSSRYSKLLGLQDTQGNARVALFCFSSRVRVMRLVPTPLPTRKMCPWIPYKESIFVASLQLLHDDAIAKRSKIE
jgi:hypothetical protein